MQSRGFLTTVIVAQTFMQMKKSAFLTEYPWVKKRHKIFNIEKTLTNTDSPIEAVEKLTKEH